MEFFGWLTKGRADLSLLDLIILISELLMLSFFVEFLFKLKKMWRKINNKGSSK